MHNLSFTLNPQAVVRIYHVISCLAKFGELVSLEATEHHVMFNTLALSLMLTCLFLVVVAYPKWVELFEDCVCLISI